MHRAQRNALCGLNRTSVGLKPSQGWLSDKHFAGLNRTSVGLKPAKTASPPAEPEAPQSNQRGIETVQNTLWGMMDAYYASIEPAWD